MSAPSTPLTYENLLELFRETREQFREITRQQRGPSRFCRSRKDSSQKNGNCAVRFIGLHEGRIRVLLLTDL